jgi:hypothetical protein
MVAPAAVAVAGSEFRLWVLVLVVYLKLICLCINLFDFCFS